MPGRYNMFTTNEIKPLGWVKRQLEIQANGLSGALDTVWPDVAQSAWIGGEREGWERLPYWLDGFIPLAYLLEDEEKIARVKKYIDAIIARQEEDGWICPCTDRSVYDTWVVFLIGKVLVQYYNCSNDERIPTVVYRIMKNYHELLAKGEVRLFEWGRSRWYECFITLNWLYARYKEEWMRDLAKILREQGEDIPALAPLWKTPISRWRHETHIVNICMLLKYECVSCDLLGEEYTDKVKELHDILSKYNGTTVGTFTGDECLAGISPIRGTELCAVVEQMYSYEQLYAYTGESVWAERLEKLAFNALPATISDDMWTHQYDQQCNQISCEIFKGNPIFGTNNREAHLFGLEPNFGCCTVNFNQAWPRFTLSAFMHNDDEIVNLIPVPVKLDTEMHGTKVSVSVEGDYPFDDKITYKVETEKEVEFTLRLRVPSFVKAIKINGKETPKKKELVLKKKWKDETITIEYVLEEAKLYRRPHNMYSLKYGPFIFSLPIKFEKVMHEYERDGNERKFPYCDYELVPKSEWNYAFAGTDFKVERRKGDDVPFSSENPRIVIKTDMIPIDWGFEEYYETVCARYPKSRKPVGKKEKKELWPYGSSKLRMTEMPKIK